MHITARSLLILDQAEQGASFLHNPSNGSSEIALGRAVFVYFWVKPVFVRLLL